MKTLLATTAIAAVFALAAPVSAQTIQPVEPPAMSPPMMAPMQAPEMVSPSPANPQAAIPPSAMPPAPARPTAMQQPVAPLQQPTSPMRPSYVSGPASWMQDDGSSSDHPIHNPGDISGERLNMEYRDGISVPPGQGFPVSPYGR